MNPLFRIDFSISDSLKIVRKSVLIYETIIQRLCKENRIDGAMNINRVWLIPKEAEKPIDRRKKNNEK